MPTVSVSFPRYADLVCTCLGRVRSALQSRLAVLVRFPRASAIGSADSPARGRERSVTLLSSMANSCEATMPSLAAELRCLASSDKVA